jgi:hypothetical protein
LYVKQKFAPSRNFFIRIGTLALEYFSETLIGK